MTVNDQNKIAAIAIMIVSGIVAIAAIAIFVFYPRPSVDTINSQHKQAINDLSGKVAKALKRADAAEAAYKRRLWTGASENVTANLMALVAKQADEHQVKLAGFRSQRAQEFDEITELPFAVQVTGSYLAVKSLLASLDSRNNKLAVRSVQLGSSDNSSNQVTATLGISVFVQSTKTDDKEDSSHDQA